MERIDRKALAQSALAGGTAKASSSSSSSTTVKISIAGSFQPNQSNDKAILAINIGSR